MKSSIKIDFIDRGTEKGIEPVIRVELIKSQDPRDTLLTTLFQSLGTQSFLQFHYSNHKPIATESGLPDMEKTVLLFKPEIDTDKLFEGTNYVFGQNGEIFEGGSGTEKI